MKNKFISQPGAGIIGLMLLCSVAVWAQPQSSVLVLHTNDVHSRIDPFPADYPRMGNQGGFARRATLVMQMREQNSHVLLFDCGDVVQGTPYFNFFGGALEIDLMNHMGYDAATLGNHEFDNGMDSLAQRIRQARFPYVCSNYDFAGTPLESLTHPYAIVEKGGLTIGVIGLGIDPAGLVDPQKCKGIRYLDPVERANHYAALFKNELGCDYVICLSHLGYNYHHGQTGDRQLARLTRQVDVILGGHTHTFLNEPMVETNLDGHPVTISQSGWGGAVVGWVKLSAP